MSLTEVSFYFRKIAPFAILSLIVMFILYYTVQLLILFVQLGTPKDVAVVNVLDTIFDKIPPPQIRESTSSANFTYTLDTIDGIPVTATTAAKVYFIPKPIGTFGFRENVYLMAKNLGFNTELTKYRLNNNEAVFADNKQKLSVDIANYNFEYEYNELNKETTNLDQARIPPEKDINTTATQILSDLGRYPRELAQGKTHLIYLAYNPATEELSVVPSPDNANLVEVDYYRPDIDGYPIVSPRYFNSQNYIILLFDDAGYKIIRSKVRFFEKSTEQVGVYPIKTGDQAWEALKTGKGYVVSAAEGVTQVSIKKMFMGYLDPDMYQEYLEPVYVFLGDNNFAAYVPAVTDEFLTVATPSASIMPTEVITNTEVTPIASDEPVPQGEPLEGSGSAIPSLPSDSTGSAGSASIVPTISGTRFVPPTSPTARPTLRSSSPTPAQ